MDSNQGSIKSDLVVYALILILACVQVFFLKGHLFAMLLVAIIQAFLAVFFFMHLGSEKPTLDAPTPGRSAWSWTSCPG